MAPLGGQHLELPSVGSDPNFVESDLVFVDRHCRVGPLVGVYTDHHHRSSPFVIGCHDGQS